MEYIETEVLVIGGGAAGTRAALEAARAGANTLLITKGTVGTAGASVWSGADVAGFGASGFADPDDSPALHLRDILESGQGMVDPVLASIVAAEAPRQLLFLKSLGVPFLQSGSNYLATRSCFSSRTRSIKIKGHGRPIVQCLRAQLLRLQNVRILEHGLVTDPLLDTNGRCVGALARDESNRRIAIQSSATILAAGGAGRLFELSLNPWDITGDGYAFGLRAGAELVNLEFMQAGFGIIGPRMNAIFQYWLWELQPTLTTDTGEPFLDRYIPAGLSLDALMKAKARHYPFSISDISRYMEIGVQSFINEEQDHRREGAVWMTLSGIEDRIHALPEDHNLRRMWDLSREMLLSAGVNLSSRFRVAPFAHAMNGGLVIDQFGRTSVEGLYAVGEVAGGPHGADRIGGNMFSTGQVFAERAGLHAALSARERSCSTDIIPPRPPRSYGSRGKALAPQEVVELTLKLQRHASRALLVVRDANPLRLFASAADDLATRLEGTDTDELNAAGMELRSLVTTGRIMGRAALLRNESRGGHYRLDFPEKRAEWDTRIFLKLNAEGEIRHRFG